MVFSVSEKVKADGKAGSISDDYEAQWDTIPATPLVYRQRQSRSTRFCIVFPWLLFLLCFVMLGCVSTWGWQEHFKAQDLMLKLEGAEKTTTTLLPTVPETPIPYGNDALPPQPEQPVEFMVNWVIQLDPFEPQDVAKDPTDGIFYPPQPQDVAKEPTDDTSSTPQPQNADKDLASYGELLNTGPEMFDGPLFIAYGPKEPTDDATPQPQNADMDLASFGDLLNTGPVKFDGPLLIPDGPIIFPCADDEPVFLPEGTKLPKLNVTGIVQIIPNSKVTDITDG